MVGETCLVMKYLVDLPEVFAVDTRSSGINFNMFFLSLTQTVVLLPSGQAFIDYQNFIVGMYYFHQTYCIRISADEVKLQMQQMINSK